jgi:hypothetical protein
MNAMIRLRLPATSEAGYMLRAVKPESRDILDFSLAG